MIILSFFPVPLNADASLTQMVSLATFTLIRGGRFETFEASRECLRAAMPPALLYDDIAFHDGTLPLALQQSLTYSM